MARREITKTGEAIKNIMEKKNIGTNTLAVAIGKPVSTICDRIYQQNISVEKLNEILAILDYKLMIVPKETAHDGYYDVT